MNFVQGVEHLAKYTDLVVKIKMADAIITGEGKMDQQTLMQKAPMQLSRVCSCYMKAVFALNGQTTLKERELSAMGISQAADLNPHQNFPIRKALKELLPMIKESVD